MKSLRDKFDRGYTQEAIELSREFREVVEPVVSKAVRNGYSISELYYLFAADVEASILRERRHQTNANDDK